MNGATNREIRIEQRQSDRVEISLRTTMQQMGLRAERVEIVNLSRDGLLARTIADFAVNSQIEVQLPIVGMVPVEIIWALGGRIGCKFVKPMHPRDFHEIVVRTARPAFG